MAILEKGIDEVHEEEIEKELLDIPEILQRKLLVKALTKANINPTKVSSEQVARALLSKETDLEENKEVLGKIIVDKVAEVENKRVAEIEKLRKKLVMALINPQMEQLEEAKVVSIALLDEEKELEDAEAMGEAIDDRVAEIHKQIMESEVKFEILQE